MTAPLKLGVLLSGGGTTLQNFLDRIAEGALRARIVVVGSSRSDAYGLVRARSAGVETFVVRSRDYGDFRVLSEKITERLVGFEIDVLLLAGFMCYYHIPERFRGRCMNIHPALLPLFGGKGLYGHHVHEAVLRAGVKVSGCTVHFADERYDHGPIIIQRTCPVLDEDTPETLAARVFREECLAYPEAVRLFGEGRLTIEGQRVRIATAPTI
ncbi:MAG: phosphoribosylglycinamide formyltransferase [Planctomycetota bacterium]